VHALSRLDIESLNIQEEDVLTLLSGSENNSISNIKFSLHTALIFKVQAKVKNTSLRLRKNIISDIKLTNPMYTALIFK
jgi:hypothetical protein